MRLVLVVALATGLSIMGDSLMYGLLPLEAPHLGIALPLVGVLLSANRLVRLVSNTWAGAAFERWGPYRPFVAATVLGAMAGLLYGVGYGFAVFLLARVMWGVAWSGLRQGGYEAVLRGEGRTHGRMMGLLWGLVRLGSAISVALGGFLRDRGGYRLAAGSIAAMTVLAIPVALGMRWPGGATSPAGETPPSPLAGWRMAWRTAPRRWLLAAASLDSLGEGALVSTASLFLAERIGAVALPGLPLIGVGTVAGFLLAVRYLADFLFGPLIGALSDRLGRTRTAFLLAVVLLAGLGSAVSLSGLALAACLTLVFIVRSGSFVTFSAISSRLASESESPPLFVGVYTT
ncbi:MAG: MFS transporter, partial [Caldilineae bacterium]